MDIAVGVRLDGFEKLLNSPTMSTADEKMKVNIQVCCDMLQGLDLDLAV